LRRQSDERGARSSRRVVRSHRDLSVRNRGDARDRDVAQEIEGFPHGSAAKVGDGVAETRGDPARAAST